MNKMALRYLGIGIFLSGTFLTIYNAISHDTPASEKDLETAYKASQEELQAVKQQLADLQLNIDKANNEGSEQTVATQPVRTTILMIETGMTPSEVSTHLENTQIIDNKNDLENYLIENNLTSRVQVGKYELSSEMSIQQIVDIITKSQ